MKDILLAKIAVSAANVSIDKPYTYQVPDVFAEQVTPGKRVLVPFGRGNRHTEGLVLALEEQETLPPRCKRILAVLDDRPVLNREGIQLALWMRERYFCSVYEAMRAMLPAGLYFSLSDRYVVPAGVTPEAAYAAAVSPSGNGRCWTPCSPTAEPWSGRRCTRLWAPPRLPPPCGSW